MSASIKASALRRVRSELCVCTFAYLRCISSIEVSSTPRRLPSSMASRMRAGSPPWMASRMRAHAPAFGSSSSRIKIASSNMWRSISSSMPSMTFTLILVTSLNLMASSNSSSHKTLLAWSTSGPLTPVACASTSASLIRSASLLLMAGCNSCIAAASRASRASHSESFCSAACNVLAISPFKLTVRARATAERSCFTSLLRPMATTRSSWWTMPQAWRISSAGTPLEPVRCISVRSARKFSTRPLVIKAFNLMQ
mmetsp:Transcript_73782/g.213482  ORF Transcript_73782/g.213482 Transcript_73782/m.213482 type:complete len:255 (-) Transcript_73782:1060-1824(-)